MISIRTTNQIKYLNRLIKKRLATSYNNPKGNAETESFIKTLKEDYQWINDFKSYKDARRKILSWIDYYNLEYPHSSIGYRNPQEMGVERKIKSETLTQKSEICV